MYCKNCGKEIDDKAVICPECGVQVQNLTSDDDTGSIGYGALGCCFPIVGLILYLVWKDNKPKNASMAGKGAIVSVIIAVIWYLLIFVIGIAGAGAFY